MSASAATARRKFCCCTDEDIGDMWIALAEILVKDHTVIVPDLRGMGLSIGTQDGGYEKTAQARDLCRHSGQTCRACRTLLFVTHETSATWSATPLRRYIPRG